MELLIPLFAIAVAVWMVPVVYQGKLIPVFVLTMVTGVVFGPPFFAIDGPIQISLDRVLWFFLFGLAAIQWRLGNLKLVRPTRVDWLILGLVGYLFLSALREQSDVPGGSPVARWLFYVAMPFGTYALARTIQLTADDLRLVYRAILGLAVFLAWTGLLEVTEQHWAIFPRHTIDPDVWEFYGRARGPLLNPIGNGIVMGLGFVIAVMEFFRSGRLGKAFFAFAAFVIMLGVYATYTRSCWMGAGGAIMLLGFLLSPRWLRIFGVVSLAVLCAAMLLGLKDQLLQIKRDKDLSAAEAAKSVELRPLLAIVAYEMFKDHPIAGHGFGQYLAKSGPYHDVRAYEMPLERVRVYVQHNSFLAILVDAGLLGFLPYCGYLLVFFLNGLRLSRSTQPNPEARQLGRLMMGLLVIYVANGMFHDVSIIDMMQMFLLFFGGLTINVQQQGLANAYESAVPIHIRRVVSLPS